jgi:hypothetical protein
MSKSRFDKAFAAYLRGSEEIITPKTFFQVMSELEQECVQRTIELRAKVSAVKSDSNLPRSFLSTRTRFSWATIASWPK